MNQSRQQARRDPMSLRDAMNQLFEDSFVSPQMWGRTSGERTLPVDLYVTQDAYILEANVPGVDPNQVEITIEGNTLSIRGETRPPTEGNNYLLQERRFSPFARTLQLDLPIQPDKVEASFRNGVLVLTLPKAEQAKPKVIKVKTA
jgi:HSP20 family protein